MKNKIILYTLFLVVLITTAISAQTVVEVTEAIEADISLSESLTGTIRPFKEINIPAEVNAVADSVKVEVGDRVNKEQELILLNRDNLLVQKRSAEAAIRSARANYEQLVNGATEEDKEKAEISYRQAELGLENAQENLEFIERIYNDKRQLRQQLISAENQLNSAEQQLESARQNLNQTKLNYEQAKRELDRMEYLYNEEVISEQQYESAQNQYKNAESSLKSIQNSVEQAEDMLETAKRSYELTKESYEDPVELQQQLANSRNQVANARENLAMAEVSLREIERGARTEQIAAAQAQLNQAEAGLEELELTLAKSIIKSPINGVIFRVNFDQGEMVPAGQPVITVVDLEQLYVEVGVSAAAISRLERGDVVEVKPEVMQQYLEGEVTNLSPAADPQSRNYQIRIKIDNPEQSLRAGMFAEVMLKKGEVGNTLVVPIEAVVGLNSDNPHLYVVEGNTAQRRDVELGLVTDTQVEILSNLELGESVIFKGQNRIEAGAEVEVISR